MNPDETFDDILRKASEIKTAQMKDKRRAWEASPEFMKNTMTFDKDESCAAMRQSASVAEKIAFAAPIKEEGNELFAKGKYAQATAIQPARRGGGVQVLEPRAVRSRTERRPLRRRSRRRSRTSTRGAKPHSFHIPQRGAVTCFEPPFGKIADGPTELSGRARKCWRSIHRAPRRTTSGRWRAPSSIALAASLELAVKDLARANALAPNDRAVRDAMRTYGAAHAEQTAKDRGRVRRGVRVAEQGGSIRE